MSGYEDENMQAGNGNENGSNDGPSQRRDEDREYRRDRSPDDRERQRSGSPRRSVKPPPVPPGRGQDAPVSNVLGCFGLSIRTRDIDLEDEFARYGTVEKAVIVYDQRSERSRGFGFVTMRTIEEAEKCIEKLNGIELHGRNIRVAFSQTQKPHASTPGEYMGFKTNRDTRGGSGGYDRGERGGYSSSRGGYEDRDRRGPPRDDRDRGYGGGRRDDYGSRPSYGGGRDRDYERRDDRDYRRRDDYDDRRGSSRRDVSPPPRRRDDRDYERY